MNNTLLCHSTSEPLIPRHSTRSSAPPTHLARPMHPLPVLGVPPGAPQVYPGGQVGHAQPWAPQLLRRRRAPGGRARRAPPAATWRAPRQACTCGAPISACRWPFVAAVRCSGIMALQTWAPATYIILHWLDVQFGQIQVTQGFVTTTSSSSQTSQSGRWLLESSFGQAPNGLPEALPACAAPPPPPPPPRPAPPRGTSTHWSPPG